MPKAVQTHHTVYLTLLPSVMSSEFPNTWIGHFERFMGKKTQTWLGTFQLSFKHVLILVLLISTFQLMDNNIHTLLYIFLIPLDMHLILFKLRFQVL